MIHCTTFSLQEDWAPVSLLTPEKKHHNITEGPTNCGRVSPEVVSPGRKSIRPMTNNTLQHAFNIRDIFS